VPLVAVTQPVPVNPGGSFTNLLVDSPRGRVYAAHPGGNGVLVADADTGNQIAIVGEGPVEDIALDAESGHLYTANGEASSVSEVDPDAQQVVRTAIVDAPVDRITYDAAKGLIYADATTGARVFVIDAKTFKRKATLTVPRKTDPDAGCGTDADRGWVACARDGSLTLYASGPAPRKALDTQKIAQGIEDAAIDPKTGTIWVAWGDATSGDGYIQGFTYRP
jgi:hypothetical protein